MPKEKNIAENADLRLEITKKITAALTEQLKKSNINKTFTDEEITKIATDKDKLRLHVQCKKVVDELEKRKNIYTSLINETGIHAQAGIARLGYYFMNTENTEEARKQNIETLKKLSTNEGHDEIFKTILDKALNMDPKLIYAETPDEALASLEKFPELEIFWGIGDFANNGQFKLDSFLKDAFSRNITAYQSAINVTKIITKMANPLYLVMPELTYEEAQLLYLANGPLKNYVDKLVDDGIEGVTKKPDRIELSLGSLGDIVANYFASGLTSDQNEKIRLALDNCAEIKNKKLLANYKYKINGEDASFEQALTTIGDSISKNQYKAPEANPTTNDFKVGSVEFISLNNEIDNYNEHMKLSQSITNRERQSHKINRCFNDLKNAKGIFTRKTPQFVKMMNSIEELINYEHNNKPTGSISEGILKQKEYINKIKDTEKTIREYLAKKSGDYLTGIGERRVNLANELLSALDTKTIEKPFSKANDAHEEFLKKQEGFKMENKNINEHIEAIEVDLGIDNDLDKGFLADDDSPLVSDELDNNIINDFEIIEK